MSDRIEGSESVNTDAIEELQFRANTLLRRGVLFSIFWLAGIGSLYSVLLARRAKRIIEESNGEVRGMGRVRWCFAVGGMGVLIWFPIFIVVIYNSLK